MPIRCESTCICIGSEKKEVMDYWRAEAINNRFINETTGLYCIWFNGS